MSAKPGTGTSEQAESDRPADDVLRRLLTLAASTGVLAAPSGPSLPERIVATAGQLLGARAASLLLIDEEKRDLVFEVALGPKGKEVKPFRVPLGQGIAGLVALSGEPMNVSDVQQDPRLASDIARAVGYWPRSILCVPLFANDQVIGILEVFDKEGAPSFSAGDMEVLGLFAGLAVSAVEQARTQQKFAWLIGDVLASCADPQSEFQEGPGSYPARPGKEDATYRRTVQLAQMVQEIAEKGDNEVQACQSILTAFLEYLKSGPAQGDKVTR